MSDYKPPYRLRPYQPGGVEKLYEEIANAGYFAILFYAILLKGEDHACGNWVGLYEKHKHPCVNGDKPFERDPLLWRLVEKHRIGVCGTGNGGQTAHNTQFEVNELGYIELYNFKHNQQQNWRDSKYGWSREGCARCAAMPADHANGKCLYGPTWFVPLSFQAAWWFPEHLSNPTIVDTAALIKEYGGWHVTV